MSTSIGHTHQKFVQALDELVAQIQLDRSILAAILCGSLSHDTVWEKSDIDLTLITIDDKGFETTNLSLNASGVNVHAFLIPRAQFRRIVEGTVRNSFMHSMLAKGRLLYTHDDTIRALCARLNEIGERDTQFQLLAAAIDALGPIDKARKWFVTRGDLDYSALWILHAANSLARIEILGARLLADRELLPQAMKLNPGFFTTVYSAMLNSKKTRKSVQQALDAIDDYLAQRTDTLFAPLLDHLKEVGEARSATELEAFFKRNYNLVGITGACEYLAHRGIIFKVSTPVHITRRSNIMVQELAFVYMGDCPDEF